MNFKKKPFHFTEHERHFTAKGDINFDLSDNAWVVFIKFNKQGQQFLSLVATTHGEGSSLAPLSIVMINLKKKGTYSLIPGEDSCSSS